MSRIKEVSKEDGKKQKYVRVWVVENFDYMEPKLDQLERMEIVEKYVRYQHATIGFNMGGFIDENEQKVSGNTYFFKNDAIASVKPLLRKFRGELERLQSALDRFDKLEEETLAMKESDV